MAFFVTFYRPPSFQSPKKTTPILRYQKISDIGIEPTVKPTRCLISKEQKANKSYALRHRAPSPAFRSPHALLSFCLYPPDERRDSIRRITSVTHLECPGLTITAANIGSEIKPPNCVKLRRAPARASCPALAFVPQTGKSMDTKPGISRLSLCLNWRTGKDSNSRPPDS